MSERGATAVESADANAVLLARYMSQVWNEGDYDVARELVADDMIVHGAGGQVVKQGPDGVIALVTAWREAFPDGRMIVHDVVSEGDMVADRLTWEGTHRGDFYGIPASNRRVRCTSIGSDRIAGGKIVEGWGELDMLGMMQQLGALDPVFPGASGTWEDPGTWEDGAGASVDTGGGSAVGTVEDPRACRDAVLQYFDCLNAGDEEALRDVVDDAVYVDHNPTTGRGGLATALRFHFMLRASLPDLMIEPEQAHLIIQDDKAFVRWTATAHHDGAPLLGAEPSGKKVQWTGSDIFRVHEGRCEEHWVSADMLSLVKQVGAVA